MKMKSEFYRAELVPWC